ncbi:uncharacterized protein PHACADRAFT_265932 [Phanerochaete carnosa HHB-10118-sp]|uniref:Uncharacterized protein n=1 Tax=Phanerochaete carnosa (strain HHB-10118-sp) TaxID=650164 RepID=K5UHJ3_PHACS|nr:uncharacterized protein PHACADRAFT_265932 [Phanerochaete carnosa HHB-10118-sp]EKM48976.1 hypothetical protein PHACADRAFT_265932 [Phanerochaete carnosa HHB-10118-sp]
MYTFTKSLTALSLLALVKAFPATGLWGLERRASSNLTGGSICPTGGFNIMAELPANINDNGGEPLPMPNTSAPVYTTLSVGMQNYTCGCDGQWAYVYF